MGLQRHELPSKDVGGESSGFVDGSISWSLVVLGLLAGFGAIIRAVGDGKAPLLERLDETTLMYLAVGGALLMLRQVKSLSFGTYKLEMLEKVREQQAKQESQIQGIALMLPLLLAKTEQKHLMNLDRGETGNYRGNHSLRSELRRLRSIGLLKMRDGRQIGAMKEGLVFDLHGFVELTPLGEQWVKQIREIERAESTAKPDDEL